MNRHPKILHITTCSSPLLGVGAVVHSLTSAAPKFGYEAKIIAGYGKSEDAHYTAINKWQYRLNVIKARTFSEDGFIMPSSTRGIIDYIISENPDIVHLHNLHGYYSDITLLKKYLVDNGIKTVMTLHDLWLTTGRCAYPPGGSCPESCAKCPFPSRYPAKWFGGKNMQSAKMEFASGITTVVPSVWMADRTGDLLPIVIYNGVDNVFSQHRRTAPPTETRLLAVATKWTELKGKDSLVQLADNMPSDWTLTLAGKDIPHHRRIINAGYIKDKESLAKLMASSSVVLSAAREEAFGMTIAEALSCGTPVVVRQGTAPEELCSPQTGKAVDFENITDLIEAIKKVSPIRVDNRDFSAEKMANRYYELYNRLLGVKSIL